MKENAEHKEKKPHMKARAQHKLRFASFVPSSEILFCSCHFPSYYQDMLRTGLIQPKTTNPASMEHPEAIFSLVNMGLLQCFTSCPQCRTNQAAALLSALGPTLQNLSAKLLRHQNQLSNALSTGFWVPALCGPSSKLLRQQASQVTPPPRGLCVPALQGPLSKLLGAPHPASALCSPAPGVVAPSCIYLRYLRVLFLPFQSTYTS